MGHQSDLSLASFFIFNSNFGPLEGQEEKKVLFYYPYDSTADARCKDVGLCEAIIKFTDTFADKANSCQVLRTQKTVQLFDQPEPDYWMIMCLNVPYERRKVTPSVNDQRNGTSNTTAAAGEYVTEYKGDNVHEKIYRQLLCQAYRMFRLFNGTFASHFENGRADYDSLPVRLMESLNDFYTKYINSLRLERCCILDVFRSLHYLPVDRLLFLQVHTFIQIVRARFPAIRHCILLYDEQLVWSELRPQDMYAVYEYLTTFVFPYTVQSIERSGSALDAHQQHQHYGTFVTAPEKFQNSVAIPKVHVYDVNDDEVTAAPPRKPCNIYDLIVYRSGGTAIGMFFDESANLTDDTYHELHTFVGPQLATIGAALADQIIATAAAAAAAPAAALQSPSSPESSSGLPAGATTSAISPRYLFFNALNLRHTGTLHVNGSRPPKESLVPAEVMNLLADLYGDETNGGADAGATEETVLKTLNDYWIVRRASNWRHGFVVVNKSSTLLSVSEEAHAIFEEHASKVFFDEK